MSSPCLAVALPRFAALREAAELRRRRLGAAPGGAAAVPWHGWAAKPGGAMGF